jgi:hypothetical protein
MSEPKITQELIDSITEETDIDKLNDKFNAFISDNIELIKKITPVNPIITKDDEWNDPEYDAYDNMDNHSNNQT